MQQYSRQDFIIKNLKFRLIAGFYTLDAKIIGEILLNDFIDAINENR